MKDSEYSIKLENELLSLLNWSKEPLDLSSTIKYMEFKGFDNDVCHRISRLRLIEQGKIQLTTDMKLRIKK